MSYDQLQQHLREQDFQRADDETRSKLIQLAGKDAVKRGWVYFSEVQFVPAQDLQVRRLLLTLLVYRGGSEAAVVGCSCTC